VRTARSIAILLAILSAGCGGGPATPLLDELEGDATLSEAGPRWPPPPAPAHISYLGSIATERAFEPRASLWRRVAQAFAGTEGLHLVRPSALCVRGSVLAVTDPGAGAVHVLDLYRRQWEVIRSTPTGVLRSPVGVACLPGDRLVVADSVLDALWVYGTDGSVEGRFGDADLLRPTGVVFDEVHSRLWVSETHEHRLRAFDLEGRELMRVGGRGSGEGRFNYPTMLAGDPDGGIWLTDSLNFRLQHVDPTGRPDHGFGVAGDRAGSFARPRGLDVDAAGRIFAVDGLLDAVQIFDPAGRLLLVFGGRGTAPGSFWLPSDVALDGRGHAFVVDSYNRRIQIFAYRPPGDG
jgi:DNA-binding beta-propeller fold protein YncE